MGKVFKSTYFLTYITLLISMFIIEVVFKVVSGITLFDYSLLRVFLGLNIIVAILSFLIHFLPNILKRIIVPVLIFAHALYATLQMGFYNFLGVYMSFQTSSQLGAVTDYIKDFLSSFHYIWHTLKLLLNIV